MTNFALDLFPDEWGDERRAAAQENPAYERLLASEVVTPEVWQLRAFYVARCKALGDGLRIPNEDVEPIWHRGTEAPCADGLLTYHEKTGEAVIHINTKAEDVQKTSAHELFHLHALVTGWSKTVSLAEEERAAWLYSSLGERLDLAPHSTAS